MRLMKPVSAAYRKAGDPPASFNRSRQKEPSGRPRERSWKLATGKGYPFLSRKRLPDRDAGAKFTAAPLHVPGRLIPESPVPSSKNLKDRLNLDGGSGGKRGEAESAARVIAVAVFSVEFVNEIRGPVDDEMLVGEIRG